MYHLQGSKYHSLSYTSHGALALNKKWLNGSTIRDRYDDPSHSTTELHLAPTCIES